MTESNKRLKTKRNIEEAMVRLLEKESFDQITTVELAQESGISRSSFYTHYRDKEPLFAVLLTENGTKEIQTFLRHKLQILLVDSLQERYSHKSLTDIERVYSSVYLTNAFFGVCQMWVSRGKKESPQQMAEFLMKMLR